MKPLFRCEYCDKIGTEEEIAKHEKECINNYNKKSCLTCKHAKNKSITCIICEAGKDIPEGRMFEHCDFWEWDEKNRTSKNPIAFNSLFGGILT